MNLKALNHKKLLRLILPSIFFIVIIMLYIFDQKELIVTLVASSFALILIVNIFLQKKIVSQILGIIFSLAAVFLSFAILSDIINGQATWAYVVGIILIMISLFMSALLIMGYSKEVKQS